MSSAPTEPKETGPVELVPDAPSTILEWLSMLAGPMIWILHFGLVYFAAEATCASTASPVMRFVPEAALRAGVIAATIVAIVACLAAAAWAARRARSGSGDRVYLARAGVLLALGSVFAVLCVGFPALLLDPC